MLRTSVPKVVCFIFAIGEKMTEVDPSQELIKIDPSQNVQTGLMVLRLELAFAAQIPLSPAKMNKSLERSR